MSQYFDNVAEEYDQTFTNTFIGKYQRDLVYEFLMHEVVDFKDKKILELNAGTGEDAVWMAKKGALVTCTDISPEMLKVAQKKGGELSINYRELDIKEIKTQITSEKFDVIFSNFGGLNCLTKNELTTFITDVNEYLTPKGKLIMVIMPSFCLWETNYFLAKFKVKGAFRRFNKAGVNAKVGDLLVKTYYYSPKLIKAISKNFNKSVVKPVGFFIPPSYLEPFFKKRSKFLKWLWKMENKTKNNSVLAPLSDHYFISLTNKN